MTARSGGRSRPSGTRSSLVGYATVALGDVVEVNGRRQRIVTIVQSLSGFTLQFPDTSTIRVHCPVEVCSIDGRAIPLADIPAGRCLWCSAERPLLPVGRYSAQTGQEVTVYACTGCVKTRRLLPLASRPPDGKGTEVRRRTRSPQS